MKINNIKPYIKIAYLLVIVIIIILPMLTQNNIVDTIKVSTDMDAHLGVAQGNNEHLLYGGQIILKYILKPFAGSEYLDTAYLWFNFFILIGVAFLMLHIFKKIVLNGKYWVIIPIMLFSTTGILGLFKYGVIFNIINVYLILIGAIYFIVGWLEDNSRLKLFAGISLLIVFSLLHYTMIYLAPIAIASGLVYIIWALIKHNYDKIKKALLISGIATDLSIVAIIFYLGLFSSGDLSINSSSIIGSINTSHILSDISLKTGILFNYISIPVMILFVIGVICWGKKSSKEKTFLYIIGICAVTLLGGYYLEINKDYNRLAIDASMMIGIFTAFMIGSTLNNIKNIPFKLFICALVLTGCVPNIIRWIS